MVAVATEEKDLVFSWRREWEQVSTDFMKRFGALTRLKRISTDIARAWRDDLKQAFMTWSLRNGLSRLKNLRQLETLDLGRGPYLQDISELQLMKGHWPCLKILSCRQYDAAGYRNWLKENWATLTVEML